MMNLPEFASLINTRKPEETLHYNRISFTDKYKKILNEIKEGKRKVYKKLKGKNLDNLKLSIDEFQWDAEWKLDSLGSYDDDFWEGRIGENHQ